MADLLLDKLLINLELHSDLQLLDLLLKLSLLLLHLLLLCHHLIELLLIQQKLLDQGQVRVVRWCRTRWLWSLGRRHLGLWLLGIRCSLLLGQLLLHHHLLLIVLEHTVLVLCDSISCSHGLLRRAGS